MTDAWKFNRLDGLPRGPEARSYRYFGFDADNAAYLLRFSPFDDAWLALGFDPQGTSHLIVLNGEHAGFIQSHAVVPSRWSELGLPPRAPNAAPEPTAERVRD